MYDILEKAYRGKKVFLTGHTGFKGTWLLKILSMLGAHVKGYSLAPETDNNLYDQLNGEQLCESIIGDLRDKNLLSSQIQDFAPDFVFHLAAQPLVRLSYQIPAETFEVNAVGTANLLEGVRLLENSCKVILITTDKVYHNNEWLYPYRESDRLGGFDPYSASKACAELIIDSYRNSFFNIKNHSIHKKSISVGRAGNVIGGGDWSADRLIPDIAKAIGTGRKIEIRNPLSVRPWQHVLEPLTGYLLLGAKMAIEPIKYSDAYNFGPYSADSLQVIKMVELAIESWEAGEYEILASSQQQPHEAGLLKLDISKAVHELGWYPKFNAEMAVKYTIDWYKTYYADRDAILKFTETQILTFLKEA